jgi:hypothetical protein
MSSTRTFGDGCRLHRARYVSQCRDPGLDAAERHLLRVPLAAGADVRYATAELSMADEALYLRRADRSAVARPRRMTSYQATNRENVRAVTRGRGFVLGTLKGIVAGVVLGMLVR